MLSYCLKYGKNKESKNPNVVKTKHGITMLLSKSEVCDSSKKSKFIKEQESRGLLSSLGLKTTSSKFPLVGPFLF